MGAASSVQLTGFGGDDERLAGHRAGGGMRFFCHECRRSFLAERETERCVFCRSSFVEEVDLPSSAASSSRQGEGRLRHSDLSEEQTRRLTSAAALLQMLETQLRDELEMLQTTLSLSGGQAEKAPPLFTQGMRDVLKQVKTSVAMICEQPSCPICSEDYSEHESVTKLPCAHIYHQACIMPWLEAKHTCPICRFELKHRVVPSDELEQELSREEIKFRLIARGALLDEGEKEEGEPKETTAELAQRLHDFLAQEQEALQQQEQQQEQQHGGMGRVLLVSTGGGGRGAALNAMFRYQHQQQQQQFHLQHPEFRIQQQQRQQRLGEGGSTRTWRQMIHTMDSGDEEEQEQEQEEDQEQEQEEGERETLGNRVRSDGVDFSSGGGGEWVSGQRVRMVNYSPRSSIGGSMRSSLSSPSLADEL